MIRGRQILSSVLFIWLLVSLNGCQSSWERFATEEKLDVQICSDVLSVRTRMGDFLDGYVAEETSNYRKRRFFVALELPKYMKGEKLTVRGAFSEDFVRASIPDNPSSEYRVFIIEMASPQEIKEESSLKTLPPIK